MNYERLRQFGGERTPVKTPEDVEEALDEGWETAFQEGLEIHAKPNAVIPNGLREPERGITRYTTYRDPKGPKKLNPRELFGQGLAAVAGFALVSASPDIQPRRETHSIEMSNEESRADETEQPGRKVTVETGKLAGRKVGSLFALYLGLSPGATVPKELHVDFGKVLEGLWDKKIRFVKQEIVRMEAKGEDPKKIKEVRDRLPNLLQAKLEVVKAYKDKWNQDEMRSISMEDIISEGDDAVHEVNDSLEWNKLNSKEGPFPRLSDNAIKLVHEMANRSNGKMILAYSLTELMPSVHDSEMNADEYEFLLKNAGAEFIASAPAVYDHWLSFGSLQFTSLALRHDAQKTEGASLINQYLPADKQIESSVKYASSFNSQMKAGQLFAIYNMGRLIQDILKDTNEQRKIHRLTVLFEKTPTMDVALLQYIASAHHNPGGARHAFEAWLDHDMQGKHSVHAKKTLAEYIVKSNGNYKALDRYDS